MYELWYMISGGSPALKQMTWSDIVNYTGPHNFLSYTFQNILKPHTNYSTINGLDTETKMQSQSKISLSWKVRQLYQQHIKWKQSIYMFGSNNFTKKPSWRSCSFEILLASINGPAVEATIQSQSKINLPWKTRQLFYSCILNKNKSSIFLDQMISLKKLCDHNECGCWIFSNMLERYQWYRTLYRMLAAAWFN